MSDARIPTAPSETQRSAMSIGLPPGAHALGQHSPESRSSLGRAELRSVVKTLSASGMLPPSPYAAACLLDSPASAAMPIRLVSMPRVKPCILLVDDDPMNIDLLEDLFEQDCDLLVANNGMAALDLASGRMPDLILLDVMMPGIDGYEVCRRLKAQPWTAGIPVIFITSLGDLAAETRGLQLGAVDYVYKPISPASIKARVNNQIRLKSAQDRLLREASTDALTGLANRGRFDDMLAYEYARHARSGTEFSIILVDIDHFKRVNDTFGHLFGDECLQNVAQAIGEVVVRTTDLAARFGGEEFVVLLPETTLKSAVVVAEKIRRRIHGLRLSHPGVLSGDRITASLGVAAGSHVPGGSAVKILSRADEQLYAAKASGRNRVCAAYAA